MILHFEDLQSKGLVKTWVTLGGMIDNLDFPPGRIVAGRRTWTEREVLDWIEAQPTTGKLAPRGAAKKLQAKKAARGAA